VGVGSCIGAGLAEAKMGAVVVIIRRIRGEKPLEVALVQGR
jgi:hypothetical protein